MGLKDLVPDDGKGSEYKRYNSHEWDSKLEGWAEEAQVLFPGGVEYDFIEVSPEMTRNHGFAYQRTENGYIRISEKAIDSEPEWYIRLVLVHELTHLWFYQNGYGEYSDNSMIFEWVLGRVGADLDGAGPGSKKYEIIKRFLSMEEIKESDSL